MRGIKAKFLKEDLPSETQLIMLRQVLCAVWRGEHEGSELSLKWDISEDEIVFSWESVEHPVVHSVT